MKGDAKQMTQTDEIRSVQDVARAVRQNVERVIVGKEEVIDLMMVALLCEGHVLFEDVPGIGKTMLAISPATSPASFCQCPARLQKGHVPHTAVPPSTDQ